MTYLTELSAQHRFVYKVSGRFAGWPANGGIWHWDDEILVRFQIGIHDDSGGGHAISREEPSREILARSLDGGETWTHEEIVSNQETPEMHRSIDFTHPDFAMQCGGSRFRISYDRGKTWIGDYDLPDVGNKLTSRTDYLVNSKGDCHFFLSAKEDRVQAGIQDRAFCARTTDGGENIEFVSWITDNIAVRSVMPSTVRISDTHLVTALRRRHDTKQDDGTRLSKNWIEICHSTDNGETWSLLCEAADTDGGAGRNGNPPSMVRLKDDRLCVTYGYRSTPYGIRAKLSEDNGKSWGNEIHLRDDGRNWDCGYTRTIQRTDGKLVTIYYYTTAENPEQHIAATIWEVDEK
ncbi:exo-alpha-sialidase [Candidatus Poribacteria bacterium]|nr:exo-alpha-sialidase [Candidatus Poribacteria bacterium]